MNNSLAAAMRQAALSTRAGHLGDATRIIQDALSGGRKASPPTDAGPIDITPARRSIAAPRRDAPAADSVEPAAASKAEPAFAPRPARRSFGAMMRGLGRSALPSGTPGPLCGLNLPGAASSSTPPAIPDGAQYLTRSFAGPAGTRGYKLYVPASAPELPKGLVVMLHGCKQDPDDFAIGTGMNAVAEEKGLLVAYPGQTASANMSSCWNWFSPADQMRDAGEPSLLAGITRQIVSEFGIDPAHVFIAGLSAGGAMAAVMAESYPELYAGIGIHSGLPYGSAHDVMSALAAMRSGAPVGSAPARNASGRTLRTIVFHGDADHTVHPINGERIVAAAGGGSAPSQARQEMAAANGRTYTRTIRSGPGQAALVEHWSIEGAGHAWSGGQAGGSYTDRQGPDASREMVRFFLEG